MPYQIPIVIKILLFCSKSVYILYALIFIQHVFNILFLKTYYIHDYSSTHYSSNIL